jgi:hypothetical protein
VLVLAKTEPDRAAEQPHQHPPGRQCIAARSRPHGELVEGWRTPCPMSVCLTSARTRLPESVSSTPQVAGQDRDDRESTSGRRLVLQPEVVQVVVGIGEPGTRHEGLGGHHTLVLDSEPHGVVESPQPDLHEGAAAVQGGVAGQLADAQRDVVDELDEPPGGQSVGHEPPRARNARGVCREPDLHLCRATRRGGVLLHNPMMPHPVVQSTLVGHHGRLPRRDGGSGSGTVVAVTPLTCKVKTQRVSAG